MIVRLHYLCIVADQNLPVPKEQHVAYPHDVDERACVQHGELVDLSFPGREHVAS